MKLRKKILLAANILILATLQPSWATQSGSGIDAVCVPDSGCVSLAVDPLDGVSWPEECKDLKSRVKWDTKTVKITKQGSGSTVQAGEITESGDNLKVCIPAASCGIYIVTATCTIKYEQDESSEGQDCSSLLPVDKTATGSATIEFVKVDVIPEDEIVCAGSPPIQFSLKECPTDVKWTISLSGGGGIPAGGATINSSSGLVNPGLVGAKYKVRATSSKVPDCYEEEELIVMRVDLKKVSFSGVKNHTVKKDDASMDFIAPHYEDNSSPPDGDADDVGDKSYPICFTRNTKMKVTATWTVKPVDPGSSFVVKGDGPGNLDFPDTAVAVNGEELTLPEVECSNPFVDEVDFMDPMSIFWSLSLDDKSIWLDAGTSDNQTYITRGDPLATVFHTVVHIGCKNADGETIPQNCIAKIWGEFTDRDVPRVDGEKLSYYKSYQNLNTTTADLLKQRDGQCSAWVKLFIDILKVQAIDNDLDHCFFRPKTGHADHGFVVKNCAFIGAGAGVYPSHPYLNVIDFPFLGETSNNWRCQIDVRDEDGIAGQGESKNPLSMFENHQVVKIGSAYYDPSYGLLYSGPSEFDDKSIAGYYLSGSIGVNESTVDCDLNGDGGKLDLGVNTDVRVFRKNSADLDIEEAVQNY